jgi:small subunit ribosomal protein S10
MEANAKKPVAKKAAPKKAAAPAGEKKVSAKKVAPAVKAEAASPKKESSKGAKLGVIRIRLSAFDHTVLDEAAAKIIETAERSGAVVHGPIPLPTHIRKFTVNRSTFVHKNARDQFEMRTHRRLIDLSETTFKSVESLQSLSLPSGVEIEIKMG